MTMQEIVDAIEQDVTEVNERDWRDACRSQIDAAAADSDFDMFDEER